MIDERGGIEPSLDAIRAGIFALRADVAALSRIVAHDKLEALKESVEYLSLTASELTMSAAELYEIRKLQAHADHLLGKLKETERLKKRTEETAFQLHAERDKAQSDLKNLYHNALRYAQYSYMVGAQPQYAPLLTFEQWLDSDLSKPQKPTTFEE